MTAAEFLAESKRIEEEATAGLARKSSTVEFVAWSRHAMEALPRMREALEAVLAYCDGNQDVPAAGVERVIESALAENGGKK